MAFNASRWRSRSLTSRVLTAASLLAVLVTVAGVPLTRTAFDLRAAQRQQVSQLAAAQANSASLMGLFVDEETGLLARERERVLRSDERVTLSWIDLPATGPLLSPMVASWSWATAEHDFRADDTLLAFTDGLVEARNADGDQFGIGRVVEIARAADLADPVALLDALAGASNVSFGGRAPRTIARSSAATATAWLPGGRARLSYPVPPCAAKRPGRSTCPPR